MLSLVRDRGNVPLVSRPLLFRTRTLVDAAPSTVVTDASHIALIDRRVVNVVNHGDVHVVDGAVVEKACAVPAPALITSAEVAVAIVDPAIKSDHRPPKAFIENKSAATPSPISRGPQKTDLRSHHPSSRNPVVVAVFVIPGPIAGSPDVAFA